MLLLLLRRRVCVGGCYARVAWNEPILSTETFQVYLNLISIWLKEIQSTRVSYAWFVIWRSQHGVEMCEARWQFPYSVYDISSLPHSLSCLQIVLPFVYSEKMFGSIRRFASQTTILFCCLPEKVLLSQTCNKTCKEHYHETLDQPVGASTLVCLW